MCVRHKWVAGQRWCWNWRLKAWAEQEAPKKGLNTKVLQTSRLTNPAAPSLACISFTSRMVPQWPQAPISYPKFVFPAAALAGPGAGGLRTGPALPRWGYLLFRAGAASLGLAYRSTWKWFLPWAAHCDLQPSGEIYSSYPGLFIICETFMTSSSS